MTGPACCRLTADRWYSSYLAVKGGHDSGVMSSYFEVANRELAPLFADLLGTGVELRIAASKSIEQAMMRPLECASCRRHIALVILSSPFMLLIFRIQAIFLSMIDRWEIKPEGAEQSRVRIESHEAGESQVKQLALGLEMYLGEMEITQEGIDELVRDINTRPPEARSVFLDAVAVAESWVVAHEMFHACLRAQSHGYFAKFLPILESNKNDCAVAAHFCEQVTRAYSLQQSVSLMWLEEFQADLMASKMLCIAIGSQRLKPGQDFQADAKSARFDAARSVLNGAAAALEGVFWVDWQRQNLQSPEEIRLSSHPPHHVRWQLISNYMKTLVGAGDDDSLLMIPQLMANLSQSLHNAYLGQKT